jgi:hypothetical protein
MTEYETSARVSSVARGPLGCRPRALPTLLRLPYLAAAIGAGATASGQDNGLAAVVMAGR